MKNRASTFCIFTRLGCSKYKETLNEKINSNSKVVLFKDLWAICESSNLSDPKNREKKLNELLDWYQKGGGLLLSFEASERILWAQNLLKASIVHVQIADKDPIENVVKGVIGFNEAKVEKIKEQLSWLRTDLKEIVGSYSKKETKIALSQIPGKSNKKKSVFFIKKNKN